MLDDRARQEAVLTERVWEPSSNAGHIGGTADAGGVPLTGYVEGVLQKRRAQKAAGGVGSVCAVVEAVRVRMPLPRQVRDEQIAKADLNRPRLEARLPADCIRVEVAIGWTLCGEVEQHYHRDTAEQLLQGTTDIAGIQTDIAIKAHPLAIDIDAEIGATLHRSRIIDKAVEGCAEGGNVMLRGTVVSPATRYASYRTARRSRGTCRVANDIIVA